MRKLWLSVILIFAFLIRLVNLTSFPVGFNADEASFGYDAYSILKTGKDQWGDTLPLVFKSFGDYKAPLYGYITVPFILAFGLTPFAVRLPSVIIGTLAVYVVYLLTNVLKNRLKIKYDLDLVTASFLAISPWSIMLSRGAFEANLITFFVPLGIYLFIKNRLNMSAFVLGLSLFTYHSAKVISPLVFFGLLLVAKRFRLAPILIYLMFLAATTFVLLSGGGARISERSITNGALEEGAQVKISLIQNGTNPILARLLHNKYQVVLTRFVENYKQYFSLKFLFSQGAGEYYYGMIHGIGVIYIFEGIFMLGVGKLIFNKKYRRTILLIIAWILISPIPAALSTGVGYSGHRAIGMVPGLQILSSLGLFGWITHFRKPRRYFVKVFAVLIGFLISLNVYKFVNVYFKNVPQESYNQMLYANLEVSKWMNDNFKGKNILLSRSISEPQIFVAFANKIDPAIYQSESHNWDVVTWVDQIPVYKLLNYTVKSIDWKSDPYSGVMIVARPSEFPGGVIPDKTFDLPDGSPIIYVKNY